MCDRLNLIIQEKQGEMIQLDLMMKCEYSRYTPLPLNLNGHNNQVLLDMPGGDSVVCLKGGYVELVFNVIHRVCGNRYATGDKVSKFRF